METGNDTSVTKFLSWGDDTVVSKENVNMTVIQFLEDALLNKLDQNDISVTRFLDSATVTETR